MKCAKRGRGKEARRGRRGERTNRGGGEGDMGMGRVKAGGRRVSNMKDGRREGYVRGSGGLKKNGGRWRGNGRWWRKEGDIEEDGGVTSSQEKGEGRRGWRMHKGKVGRGCIYGKGEGGKEERWEGRGLEGGRHSIYGPRAP